MKRRYVLPLVASAMLMLPAVGVAAAPSGAASPPIESAPVASKSIPFKQEEPVNGAFLAKLTLVMLVLLGATAGVLFMARRCMGSMTGGRTGATGKIELIEIRRLTPKLTMLLVRVRGHEVLLAQHGDSLVVIEGWERAVQSELRSVEE